MSPGILDCYRDHHQPQLCPALGFSFLSTVLSYEQSLQAINGHVFHYLGFGSIFRDLARKEEIYGKHLGGERAKNQMDHFIEPFHFNLNQPPDRVLGENKLFLVIGHLFLILVKNVFR